MCIHVSSHCLSASARSAAGPAEHTGGGNFAVPHRRQLRRVCSHRAVAGLLQDQLQLHHAVGIPPGPAAPVLQDGARADRTGRRHEERPRRVPGGAGRDRRQRLQLLVLLAQLPRHAEPVHAGGGRPHRRRRPGGDQPRRQDGARPGELPHRLRAAVPGHVPEHDQLGLRPVRLPRLVQRILQEAQPAAAAGGRPAPVAEPRRSDHLRGLLRRRLAVRPEPPELR